MGWLDSIKSALGFDDEPVSARISDEQMAQLDAEEQARAANQNKGFFDKVGDFFTDDPKSGWYDTLRTNSKLADDADYYLGNNNSNPMTQLKNSIADDANYYLGSNPMTDPARSAFDALKGNIDVNKLISNVIPQTQNAEKPSSFFDTAKNFISQNPNLIGGAAQVASGLGGYMLSKDNYEKALETTRQAADLAGSSPELGVAQASLIQDNPELQAMQMQALKKIQEQALTGTNPEDEAYRRQQQNLVNKQFQARNAQIQDDMNRRGVQVGSGLQLAQNLTNNQATTQQASEAADADMIRKANAKTAAISNLANTSGQIQQQNFDRDLSRASATDKFNMENVTNKIQAARNKANMLGNVAAAEAQKGSTKANLSTGLGNVVNAAVKGKNFNLGPKTKNTDEET